MFYHSSCINISKIIQQKRERNKLRPLLSKTYSIIMLSQFGIGV